MPIRRQDIGVLLLHYLGYAKIRNLILRSKHKPVATFVYFHDIPLAAVNHFESKLNFLKCNTNVVSFDNFISGKLNSEKINVVITFDDGYKSWITHAVPILRKLELPATFFISSGFVGLSKTYEDTFIRNNLRLKQSYCSEKTVGLTCDDIRRIADHGFTIGGHTLSHCNLSDIMDITKLKYEIAEDKLFLEQTIGTKINYFSYPFGFYYNPNINIDKVLHEAGYKGAVTTMSGFNDRNTYPFLLHRESTDATMHSSVFKARVYGNYDAVHYIRKLIGLEK